MVRRLLVEMLEEAMETILKPSLIEDNPAVVV